MRSRLAIVALLMLGPLFGAPNAFASSALSTAPDSSTEQYGQSSQPVAPANVPPPAVAQVAPTPQAQAPQESVAGTGEQAPAEATQEPSLGRVAASGELPFTGYAVIPIVVLGVSLLCWGLVLRRRTSPTDRAA